MICMTGVAPKWVATAGFGSTIAAGYGPWVWVTNVDNNVYAGTGREYLNSQQGGQNANPKK
jgi:hypothetical protein